MDHNQLQAKVNELHRCIKQYSTIAVAWSGGVDSTVLLDNCCTVLGKQRVLAIQARTCLLAEQTVVDAEKVMATHFVNRCIFDTVELEVLAWENFLKNDDQRCYHCKKNIYNALLSHADQKGFNVLADGTNRDDLQATRPGMKAIQELGVVTPLVDAGWDKETIRLYAQSRNLINHDLPSNSCLATRLDIDQRITVPGLQQVEMAEKFLMELGFYGCRVKPRNDYVLLELQEDDVLSRRWWVERDKIVDFFQQNGFGQVYLALRGR